MPSPSAARTAALAAVLFGISFFLTVASVNVPHTSDDATLLAWWRQDTNVELGPGLAALRGVHRRAVHRRRQLPADLGGPHRPDPDGGLRPVDVDRVHLLRSWSRLPCAG